MGPIRFLGCPIDSPRAEKLTAEAEMDAYGARSTGDTIRQLATTGTFHATG